MAFFDEKFDSTMVEPAEEFKPLPPGWYTAVITDTEMRETKLLTGRYLQLTLQILDGEYKGRVVFDRLNLENRNQTAVDIARRTLSSICHAAHVLQLQAPHELHGIPISIKLGVTPATDRFNAGNEVKAYKSASGNQDQMQRQPGPTQAQRPAAAPQPTATVQAPWGK